MWDSYRYNPYIVRIRFSDVKAICTGGSSHRDAIEALKAEKPIDFFFKRLNIPLEAPSYVYAVNMCVSGNSCCPRFILMHVYLLNGKLVEKEFSLTHPRSIAGEWQSFCVDCHDVIRIDVIPQSDYGYGMIKIYGMLIKSRDSSREEDKLVEKNRKLRTTQLQIQRTIQDKKK
ncbi:hypothetical protein ADUPG1_012808 [Aduncisulcus paluster]|uniref:Uncharacterized protein n=1 Tax=Aduncisulcus paluster TaxID=2918883 RepID=A0ABQ5K1F1_9EUKA|nr:hypothetical protein ADUPG1_012808 [Aduncisulcus paluster]